MNIDNILRKFAQLNVLVVGDLMIDQYLLGVVNRVSPEAPVPIVEWKGAENRLGGAANVASNVVALGAKAVLCGVVGKDEESELFYNLLNSKNIDSSLVLQITSRQTTIKSRVIANDQHLLRIDKEERKPLEAEQAKTLIKRVIDYLRSNRADIIILQDYNKGVLTPSVIKELIQLGESFQVPIAVDPKYTNFWAYQNVQLFKPNLKEIKDVIPFEIFETEESLSAASSFIQNKLASEMLMVTLSDKGLLIHHEQQTRIYPTDVRQVADVCGAGDAVIAIGALGYAAGLEQREIAMLANLAGGQIVEKVGVVTIDKDQLAKEIRQKTAQL
ncbi:MAG: PfkB family carbohydrate kinase [Bacteroidota bacterium]